MILEASFCKVKSWFTSLVNPITSLLARANLTPACTTSWAYISASDIVEYTDNLVTGSKSFTLSSNPRVITSPSNLPEFASVLVVWTIRFVNLSGAICLITVFRCLIWSSLATRLSVATDKFCKSSNKFTLPSKLVLACWIVLWILVLVWYPLGPDANLESSSSIASLNLLAISAVEGETVTPEPSIPSILVIYTGLFSL